MIKYIKRNSIFLFCFLCVGCGEILAQNNVGKANDIGRIVLGTYVPNEQMLEIPVSARRALVNKLSQIVTKHGMGGGSMASRFIITAQLVQLDKVIVTTPPAKHIYTLELTLYIGDAVTGELFDSDVFDIQGVGATPAKAYIAALRTFSYGSERLKSFMKRGKEKIISYYNSNCDFILKQGETLAAQQKFDEAIATLSQIPKITKGCFEKAMEEIVPIYRAKINLECRKLLAQAKNTWNASQDAYAAQEAINYLYQINPESSCFNDADMFSKKLEAEVKRLNDRELQALMEDKKRAWELEKMKIQSNTEIHKITTRALQSMGLARQRNEGNALKRILNSWFGK